MLDSTSASPRVRFDCVMLLSDLLESAITARARAGERFPPTPRCVAFFRANESAGLACALSQAAGTLPATIHHG